MITIMSNQLYHSLKKLAVQTVSISRGEYLFHQGDLVNSLYLVEDGQLTLMRNQENGGTLLLNRTQAGAIVAEASLYSDHYHCSCIGEAASRLLQLPRSAILRKLSESAEISMLWSAYLANELQNSRYRSELLTMNKVSERLIGWIEWNGQLPPKGSWKNLAAELGITPEALYREIKKQRKILNQ